MFIVSSKNLYQDLTCKDYTGRLHESKDNKREYRKVIMTTKKYTMATPPYYVFADGEYTTNSRQPGKEGEILSMSVIVANGKTLEIEDKFVGYIRPQYPDRWNEHAVSIHGFTKEAAADFPAGAYTLIEFLKFMIRFKNDDNSSIPFVFHGTNKLDYKMFEQCFTQYRLGSSFYKLFGAEHVISTSDMFKFFTSIFGIRTPDHKLNSMAKTFELTLNHHEVESDTMVCYQGFKAMSEVIFGK